VPELERDLPLSCPFFFWSTPSEKRRKKTEAKAAIPLTMNLGLVYLPTRGCKEIFQLPFRDVLKKNKPLFPDCGDDEGASGNKEGAANPQDGNGRAFGPYLPDSIRYGAIP